MHSIIEENTLQIRILVMMQLNSKTHSSKWVVHPSFKILNKTAKIWNSTRIKLINTKKLVDQCNHSRQKRVTHVGSHKIIRIIILKVIYQVCVHKTPSFTKSLKKV